MKSRLKKYIVKVNFSHESFGGYDHNDGDKCYEVFAQNENSASKKGLKIAENEGGGYDRKVINVYLQ